MGCCGRANNRSKKEGAAGYYERYGYLNSNQRAKQRGLGISTCKSCDAFTSGNPCSICGKSKTKQVEEDK